MLSAAVEGADHALQRSAMQDIDDILHQRELERLVEDQQQVKGSEACLVCAFGVVWGVTMC